MSSLEQAIVILLIIAALDAIFSGSLTAYLQKNKGNFKIIKVYQFFAFMVTVYMLIFYMQLPSKTMQYLVLFWVCYWEDILYYWLLRPLSYFHELFLGYRPLNEDGQTYEMFEFRSEYTGWYDFLFDSTISKRKTLIISTIPIIYILYGIL